MNYKVLYRKYRPDNFDSLVGQNYTKQMLLNIINSDKVGHAYIFTGPRGTGKTSSAKLFAKTINCLDVKGGNCCGVCSNCISFNDSPDIIEIDAASNNGVDEIRNLIDNVKLYPTSLKYKVYIIDEVHMLTTSAFNALLLTLEEPPSHVVFILATTDIQSVPITILSRCQRYDFRPVDNDSIINRMKFICKEESINITDEALNEIAYISAGGMRDALSMLDQLSAKSDIDIDMVIQNFGTISSEKIMIFIDKFIKNDLNFVLNFLNDVMNKGIYYSVFLEKVISELRIKAVGVKFGTVDYDFDVLFNLIFDLNECLSKTNININPYILVEMVFLKYLNINLDSTESVAEKIVVDNNNVELKSNEVVVDISPELDNNDIVAENSEGLNINNSSIDEFKLIRINNCFVGVNKEEKESFSKLLNRLIDYLNINDRYLLSLIADSSVLAASKDYILISSSVDSVNSLINKELSKFEGIIEKEFGSKVKLLALTENEWSKIKIDYVERIKSGYKYTFIDENIANDVEESDELEKLALEIFGSDNIQFN